MKLPPRTLPIFFLFSTCWFSSIPRADAAISITPGPGIFVGTLDSEIGGLAGPGVNPNGNDQTQVVAPPTITGSNLNVQGFNAFLPAQGDSFQIISTLLGAPTTVTGTFTAVTFDADGALGLGLPVANAAVLFDVNTGAITATGLNAPASNFGQLGVTSNQITAATAIFNAAQIAPNQIDSSTIAGVLALQIVDAVNGSAVDLARYTPEYYGSLADYARLGDQVLARSIQDRVSPMHARTENGPSGKNARSQPENGSVFFNYLNSSQDTADNATLSRNDFQLGANLVTTDRFVAGLAVSLSEGSISSQLGSADAEGLGGMIYARGLLGDDFTIFGSLGYSQQDYDLQRATVNGLVSGTTDASTYTSFVGIQHRGWQLGQVSIAPRVSVSYSQTDIGSFSEAGAIDALNVGGYSASVFSGEAGLSALWRTELAGRPFSLELALSMQQPFHTEKDQMQVSLVNLPAASYPITFAGDTSSQAVVRLNAGYEMTQSCALFAGYEGRYGGNESHYIKGGFRFSF